MNPISTASLATATKLTPARVRQLAPELEKAGLAKKYGPRWGFSINAVDWIFDNRKPVGRPRINKNQKGENTMKTYQLTKESRFQFENDEIASDPILAYADQSTGGSFEVCADSVDEAFEVFFNCTFDDPAEFLPDFYRGFSPDTLTTAPNQPGEGYVIAEI